MTNQQTQLALARAVYPDKECAITISKRVVCYDGSYLRYFRPDLAGTDEDRLQALDVIIFISRNINGEDAENCFVCDIANKDTPALLELAEGLVE